jgi:probable phosphomutase (TIGR03848 family)
VDAVPTVLLVRHGRTAANASGTLAGWTPGIGLDDVGRAQAQALAARLATVPVTALVTSPLQRCRETGEALLAVPGPRAAPRPEAVVDDRLGEARYGDWTGRPLKELAKEPLWKVVQAQPSAVRFPNGEALAEMAARAVAAVRDWDVRLGNDAVWVASSHGDVIKAIVADALGLHLDQYQRIVPDPCSVTVIRYTSTRPYVIRVNDTGGDLSGFAPPKRRRRRADGNDATIGGGTGGGTV